MKVIISGPLLSMSGYGNHARQVLDFVFEKHKNDEIFCDVTSWGNTNWSLSKDFLTRSVFDKIINNFISEAEINRLANKNIPYFNVSYQICFPDQWSTMIAKKNIGFFAGIETTICCEKWIDQINLMDKVVVPSNHALNSVNNAVKHYYCQKLDTDVCVIPEWFYDDFSNETTVDIFNLEEVKTENNVLIIGQLSKINPETDRKNILNTLEASILALKGTEWGIILKMFTENNSYFDFHKTKKILKTYIDLTFKDLKLPKIYLVHGNMKNKEIKGLYNSSKVKCLVSGTRGEGFGLTFLEAAASGIPIVATKWSAYDEYLDYYLGVDFDLVSIPASLSNVRNDFETYSNIWVENSKWAEFNKKSMIDSIIKVTKKDFNSVKILNQQKSILNKYSKNSIMCIYNKQLGRQY